MHTRLSQCIMYILFVISAQMESHSKHRTQPRRQSLDCIWFFWKSSILLHPPFWSNGIFKGNHTRQLWLFFRAVWREFQLNVTDTKSNNKITGFQEELFIADETFVRKWVCGCVGTEICQKRYTMFRCPLECCEQFHTEENEYYAKHIIISRTWIAYGLQCSGYINSDKDD